MADDGRQLGLFEQPEVEVQFRADRVIITYNRPHTVTISLRDRLAVRYEAVRLMRSELISRRDVARKFRLHPDTLSDYIGRFQRQGLRALVDRSPGPKPGRREARFRARVLRAYREDPSRSAAEIHRELPPRSLSLKAVRRILRELKGAGRLAG